MIIITGWRSQIAREFRGMLPAEEAAVPGSSTDGRLPNADRYLFCQGLLRPKPFHEQTPDEVHEGYWVNCGAIIAACDGIFERNERARVCVIGSESGYRGSFDGTYAAAKADLHRYVETKPLNQFQQLVGISPGIVENAQMTTRRTDAENLDRRRAEHPKRRFLTSREVAEVAYFALYQASDFLSNHVVRLHGGLP